MGNAPTHGEMVAAVARWRNNGKRLIWTETGVGSAWLSAHLPIPDVYTLEQSYDPKPIVYECKVSRSDFMSDLRSRKWAKYLPISTRLYFAVPHGMVGRDEVPGDCGLVTWEPGADKWRTPVRAAVRECSLTDHQWLALLFAMQSQRIRVRDCAERERAIRNLGLLPARHQLAADVRDKLAQMDEELAQMQAANKRIMTIEEWTRQADEAAKRALERAQSHPASILARHIAGAAHALQSERPDDAERFVRQYVVGHQGQRGGDER
jgi:hypothetical protein